MVTKSRGSFRYCVECNNSNKKVIKKQSTKNIPCCLSDKARRSIKGWSPVFDLYGATLYHLVYHYSLSLHINHLLFLHTYGIGIGILTLGLSSFLSFLILFLYCIYILLLSSSGLTKNKGLLYGLLYIGSFVILQIFAVSFIAEAVNEFQKIETVALGLLITLVSFMMQLIGHCLHENFATEPHLVHGFIAAPFLEFVSLLIRCKIIDTYKIGSILYGLLDRVECHRSST
jgi:hypothetical protein